MPSRFTTTRRVAFAETDMAGIVHFANFYRYMEEAEHAFFRSVGRSISEKQPDGSYVGWPRVSASCSFKSPARYEDLIEIQVTVERIGLKSMTMRYDFYRDGMLLAKGSMKIVCCRLHHDAPIESIAIPERFTSVFEEEQRPTNDSNHNG